MRPATRLRFLALIVALIVTAVPIGSTPAVNVTVTGTVAIVRKGAAVADHSDVAVWLRWASSADGTPAPVAWPSGQAGRARIVQKGKQFEPRMLVVASGSVVDFPNFDPFFHNVFSLYDGKRFDLGLYEAGTSRTVTFSRPGVCYVFCNIHPDMSAIVVTVDTPYYAVSAKNGAFTIPNVPAGRYLLSAWHERHRPEGAAYPREVTIGADATSLGVLRFVDADQPLAPHKNKYGQDYTPPQPTSPLYK